MALALIATEMAVGLGVTTLTTAGINTTGADFLLATISANGVSNWVPTDSNGNTWTIHASNAGGYGGQRLASCIPTTVGAGHTLTWAHGGGNDYPTITFSAFSGVANPAIDLSGNGSDGANSSGQTTGTLSQADELIVFLSAPSSGDADVAHTWQNSLVELNGSPVDWANYYPHAVGYKTVASTASTGMGLSWDEGQSGQDFVWATFKLATGAPTAVPVRCSRKLIAPWVS